MDTLMTVIGGIVIFFIGAWFGLVVAALAVLSGRER